MAPMCLCELLTTSGHAPDETANGAMGDPRPGSGLLLRYLVAPAAAISNVPEVFNWIQVLGPVCWGNLKIINKESYNTRIAFVNRIWESILQKQSAQIYEEDVSMEPYMGWFTHRETLKEINELVRICQPALAKYRRKKGVGVCKNVKYSLKVYKQAVIC